MDELLTTEEVAALLKTPVATVRYWRHVGTGPRGVKIGRRVLYRADDIRSWVDAKLAEAGVA